jgi:glycosyltransferase involved in cell wall biosynthesis
VRRTLRGLQLAAKVVCVSQAVRDQLVSARIVDRARTEVVPNGVYPAFTRLPDATADSEAARLLGEPGCEPRLDLLHVGLPIPRKRIDHAIDAIASISRTNPSARLIRVGGPLPPDLRARAVSLGVADRVVELPFLSPAVLAAVYRRASVVLLPSDSEGFGLPILESLTCGTPVVANDLPVLRETGGEVARYRTTRDIGGWCVDVLALAGQSPDERERWRRAARAHAARFTWRAAAERLLPLYRELGSR